MKSKALIAVFATACFGAAALIASHHLRAGDQPTADATSPARTNAAGAPVAADEARQVRERMMAIRQELRQLGGPAADAAVQERRAQLRKELTALRQQLREQRVKQARQPEPAAPEPAADPVTIRVHDQPTVAVLYTEGTPRLVQAATLLEVELANRPELRVVDRAQFQQALNEARLQLALADPDPATRRRAFAMLDAAVIVVLTADNIANDPIRATVLHTPTGLKTASLSVDAPAGSDEWTRATADELIRHLREPERQLTVVALPPVIDGRLLAADPQTPRVFHQRLRALLLEAEVAVLGFEDAQNLQREQRVRGDQRLSPIGRVWFLQTRLNADLATPQDAVFYASLQANGRAVHTAQAPADQADTLALKLRDHLVSSLKQPLADRAQAQTPLEALAAQAESARAAGKVFQAIDVIETLVLYQPEDLKLRNTALELFYDAIEIALADASPANHEAERMTLVTRLFARACDHADELLRLTTPATRTDSRLLHAKDPQLQFRRFRGVIDRIANATWAGERASRPAALPEPFRTDLAEPYHRLLTRQADRLLDALDRGTPPLYLKKSAWALETRHDIIPDGRLMDLRVRLWERLFRYTLESAGRGNRFYAFPPYAEHPDIRRAILRAIDRRLASQAAPSPAFTLALEANRAGMSEPYGYTNRQAQFKTPETLPPFEAPRGAAPTDQARRAARDQADLVHQSLPEFHLTEVELPMTWDPVGQVWSRRNWLGVRGCGEHGDLIWTPDQIHLLRPDRRVELLCELTEPDKQRLRAEKSWFYEPVFDGRSVWAVLPRRDTLLVRVDPATGDTQAFGPEHGLPPTDGGASLAALGPGRLVLSGALRRDGDLSSFALHVEQKASAVQLTTIYQARSAQAPDETSGVPATTVGRSRLLHAPGDPKQRFVLLEIRQGWSIPARMLDANSSRWALIDLQTHRVEHLPFVGLPVTRTLEHPVLVTFGPGGAQGFSPGNSAAKRLRLPAQYASLGDPLLHDGWELRFLNRGFGPELHASPKPQWATRPIARLTAAHGRAIDTDSQTHLSPHHGLMVFNGSTLRATPFNPDLETAYYRAKPVDISTKTVGTQIIAADGDRRGGYTFAQALEIARGLGTTLPTNPEALSGYSPNQLGYFNGVWLNYSADKRGRLQQADLLPPDQGRFAVALTRNRQFTGYQPQHAARVAIPWGNAAPPPKPAAAGLGPPVVALPPRAVRDTDDHAIPAGLSLAQSELTELQWVRVMEPQRFSKLSESYRRRLAWTPKMLDAREAREFCRKLSQLTGQTWRLPTEAEWLYACLAGNDPETQTTDTQVIQAVAWCSAPDQPASAGGPNHVASRQPNAWGFYDMQGNLAEWTASVYTPLTGEIRPLKATDPANTPMLLRGGAWHEPPSRCLATSRRPAGRSTATTVRVLLDQSDTSLMPSQSVP